MQKGNTSFLLKALLLLLCLVGYSVQANNQRNEANKPNFVWLISEDNSPEYLNLYNKNGAVMPNLAKLAEHGLLFKNAYSTTPVCSTARSTLAMGAYTARTDTLNHRAFHKADYKGQLKSIYQLMKEAGYFVSNNAKTDFNFSYEQDKLFSQLGKSASWQNRKPNQNFFHIQTFTITHESNLLFPVSDVHKVKTQHDQSKVIVPKRYPNTELFRHIQARYLDLHLKLDAQIGAVIHKLQQDNLLEDTFIFYFSDHGGALPYSKGFATETGLKVPLVVRVPENFRHLLGDGFTNQEQVDGVVSFLNLPPTLLKLAGLPEYKQHDGKAMFSPDLDLKQLNKWDTVLGFADRFGEKLDLVRTIRVGKYKYVRNFMPFIPDSLYQDYRYKSAGYQKLKALHAAGKLTEHQEVLFKPKAIEALYDLSRDPEELVNLAILANHQKTLKKLRSELTEQLKVLPDLGFIPESEKTFSATKNSLKFAGDNQFLVSRLIDIANLSLQPFEKVKGQLVHVLNKGNQLEQYWALIALSSMGKQANSISNLVQSKLASFRHPLVKARAIEFLAIVADIDPQDNLQNLLKDELTSLQVLETLNIAASLHDSLDYQFIIQMAPEWQTLPAKSSTEISAEYSGQKMLAGAIKNRIIYLNSAVQKSNSKSSTHTDVCPVGECNHEI